MKRLKNLYLQVQYFLTVKGMYVILQCIKIEMTKKPLGKSLIFFSF
jgi:hypothetical protein